MENPVTRNLKSWLPAVAGFIAAAFMIAWMRPAPPRVTTLEGLLGIYLMAAVQVLIVAVVSAITALLVLLICREPAAMAWRVASRAVWVVPLYLFLLVRSGWALLVMVCLVLGFVHAIRNLQPAVQQRAALSSGARILFCVIAGAGIEVALVASGTERLGAAVPAIALAALIIAWQATKPGRSGHPARGLVTMFLAVVLSSGALVWRVGVRDGDSLLGFPIDPALAASLYALQKTFGGGQPVPFVPNRGLAAKGGDANVTVQGAAHRGIFLWPEVKKEATLVPPLPSLGRLAFGKDHQTPLTIPFYGAYWFFRPPYLQPPFGSLVVHGSPAVKQFVNNDNSPLWEEAHQNLQTSFDLRCCSRIEVDFTNADKQADLVEIELSLIDSSYRGRQIQSLGRKRLLTLPETVALPETLSYAIPVKSKVTRMDEMVVRFRLVNPRWSESAQVAIERFRLVPRGVR